MSTPELLVVGHVTRDEIGGTTRLGGAAGFAARAAALLGVRTSLVTAAPPAAAVLDELRAIRDLAVHCRSSPTITTFAVDYHGAQRRLTLLACADPIDPEDVPVDWRAAPVVYLGPVAGECDRRLVECFGTAFVGVGLQGWLRRAGADGLIEPWLADEATHPLPGVCVAVFSELDHPDAERIAETFASAGAVVALTRAAAGALILAGERRVPVPAAPADEVDPTGAGDVFGVVFTLALARGASLAAAGAAAAQVAARVVEGPGLGRLTAADSVLIPSRRPGA
jgi:sugar/nucleoside kinase (ribokinase family)